MSTDVVTVTQELETSSLPLVVEARALRIVDAPSYLRAGEIRKLGKAYRLKIDELMDPICHATNEAHKTAVGQKKRLLALALEIEERLGPGMVTYDQKQMRLRLEAEVTARQERERAEAEARSIAEKEAARLMTNAEDERLRQAIEADAAGDRALAERLIAVPLPMIAPAPVIVFTPPLMVETPPKVAGISYRDNWSGEVTDFPLLIKAVAAGDAPMTLLQINQVALNQLARAMRENCQIPGVRTVNKPVSPIRT